MRRTQSSKKQQGIQVNALQKARADLATAQKQLADSESRLDAQGISDALRLIEANQRIIAQVEARVEEADQASRETAAKELAKELAASLNTTVGQIDAVQQEVIEKIGVVVEAIQREAALRSAIQQSVLGMEALCARYPSIRARVVVKEPSPAFADYVGLVAHAANQLYRLRRRSLVLEPSMTRPRDTEAQKQWEWMAALRKVVEKFPSQLPPEVLDVVTPLPELGKRPPDAPDSETFAQSVERALSAVPGASSVTGIG